MWHDFRSNVNQHMMQPRAIKPHVAQVDQVSTEFVEKMRKLRDAKSSKLPATFNNEMNKWALECKYLTRTFRSRSSAGRVLPSSYITER